MLSKNSPPEEAMAQSYIVACTLIPGAFTWLQEVALSESESLMSPDDLPVHRGEPRQT
jgi:hypothetical protein